MIQALPKAKELWEDPQDLIAMWKSDPHKERHEKLISNYINFSGYLVDLGCGIGRFSKVLSYAKYQGYDQSPEMIRFAKGYTRDKRCQFSCVDIFEFISDQEYDTLIMIDVAHHQQDPLGAVEWVLKNWKAKRYFFTLLLGDSDEELLNSFVIARDNFQDFALHNSLDLCYNEKNNFDWVLFKKE